MRLLFAAWFSTILLALIAIEDAKSGKAIQPIAPKFPDLRALPVSLRVAPACSCKELYNYGWRESKSYMLQTDSGNVAVYCQMTSIGDCEGGGWTLVMKMDGHKRTFHYSSSLWTNKKELNRALYDAVLPNKLLTA